MREKAWAVCDMRCVSVGGSESENERKRSSESETADRKSGMLDGVARWMQGGCKME